MKRIASLQAKFKDSGKTFPYSLFFLISIVLVYACMILPTVFDRQLETVMVGQVAPQEILAPYSLTFESKIFTERARQDTANNVLPIYLPSDPDITKAQLEKLNNIVFYISTVRNDLKATHAEQLDDLQQILMLHLSTEQCEEILDLEEKDWQTIASESNRVLEQVLRESLRNDQVNQARSNLPVLLDFSLQTKQSQLVIAIVSPLVVPTSLYSEELTENAREQARSLIEPVARKIINGEVLVRRGQIVRDEDLEALKVFGMAEPNDNTNDFIRSAVLLIVLAAILVLYSRLRKGQPNFQPRALVLTVIFFLLFLGIARFFIMGRTILPYIFPIAAFTLTLSILFNKEFALIITISLIVLTVHGQAREAELILFYLLPTLVGMFTIRKARRIPSFIVSGLAMSVCAMAVVFIFRWRDGYTDLTGFSSIMVAAMVNGIFSSMVTLLIHQLFALLLDTPTPLQLMDISRPDHPLLQLILQNAPGSYQHSLQVSNLAEQAADAIGADRLLVRVGSLYHDAGKANNPTFFIENQVRDNMDPHDKDDPETSAATIIAHVTDGVILSKKYRLPSRVIDFIREHHGTMYTRYQYNLAKQQSTDPNSIDIKKYTYPGPAPRSRETAIVMLADGTEARARANTPQTDAEIKAIIQAVLKNVRDAGQLDNTDLTLKDLNTISDSFFNTLQRSYHPRIKYPEVKESSNTQPFTPAK